jgi:hypothetical protein
MTTQTEVRTIGDAIGQIQRIAAGSTGAVRGLDVSDTPLDAAVGGAGWTHAFALAVAAVMGELGVVRKPARHPPDPGESTVNWPSGCLGGSREVPSRS